MIIDYFRRHLGAKIFFLYLLVIVLSMLVLVIASQFILPAAFNRHMAGMMGSDMMNGMMGGQGSTLQLHTDFRASFNEALSYAALAAVIASLRWRSVFCSVEVLLRLCR